MPYSNQNWMNFLAHGGREKLIARLGPDCEEAVDALLAEALIYEQVPTMKTGDVYTYNIASPELKGLGEATLIWPHFWNVSK